MKVKRCQGWYVRSGPITLTVAQCDQPAEYDGVRCHEHKDQTPVEWMEEKCPLGR